MTNYGAQIISVERSVAKMVIKFNIVDSNSNIVEENCTEEFIGNLSDSQIQTRLEDRAEQVQAAQAMVDRWTEKIKQTLTVEVSKVPPVKE